jgi:hypothetical protein
MEVWPVIRAISYCQRPIEWDQQIFGSARALRLDEDQSRETADLDWFGPPEE